MSYLSFLVRVCLTTCLPATVALAQASGSVGIGTTTPTQVLDVNGGLLVRGYRAVSNQGAYLQWNRNSGDGGTWLLNQPGLGSGSIVFGSVTTNDAVTEWGRFASNGFLGLGTNRPSTLLDLGASYGSSATDAATKKLAVYNNSNGSDFYGLGVSGGYLHLFAGATSTAAPRLSISNAGNVGIGTSAPSQLLEVAGTVYSNTGGFKFPDGTTQTTAAVTATGANFIQNQTTQQASSNFNISGSGTVGGTLTAQNAVVTTALTGNGADIGTTSGIGVRADGGLNIGQTTGNIFLGYQAGKVTTTSNNGGYSNLFFGTTSGVQNTSGYQNIFLGQSSGYSNTTGYQNIYIGYQSGVGGTTSNSNAYLGYFSGYAGSGSANTFTGAQSGFYASGSVNTFSGYQAGYRSGGDNNTYLGAQSGYYTQVSFNNTCIGYKSGYDPSGASFTNNTFLGYQSGFNETGSNNTIIGTNSDYGPQNSQYVTSLGYASGPSANGLMNATAIGAFATVGANNALVLGGTGSAAVSVGIGTATPGSTLQVVGSMAASIRTLSSGTIADADYTVLVTGNVSLPAPTAGNTGRLYHLLNGNTANNTVTGTFRDAGTSSTFTSFTLGVTSGGKGITVQSDGTQWWIVGRE